MALRQNTLRVIIDWQNPDGAVQLSERLDSSLLRPINVTLCVRGRENSAASKRVMDASCGISGLVALDEWDSPMEASSNMSHLLSCC
jgi:hypothetical protein